MCWALTVFFLIVLFVSAGIHNEEPEKFIFDHEKGWVSIHAKSETNIEAYIQYAEIKKLDIHVKEIKGKNSTTYVFYGYLEKLDGSKWHFVKDGNRNKVEEAIKLILPLINTAPKGNKPPRTTISSKIEKLLRGDTALLYWQNKAAFRSFQLFIYTLLWLGIVTLCFCLLFLIPDIPLGAKIAIVIFLLLIVSIFGYYLLLAIKRNLKNLFRKFAIAITPEKVEYYEFNKNSGKQKVNVALAVSEINSIRFTFVSWENFKKPIEIIPKDKNAEAVAFYMDALNPVECLQVENWIQETLKEKAGIVDWHL
jgi:hypothetical protein